MTSILTYKITKRFSVKRDARSFGLILAGWTQQAATAFSLVKTGSREWTIRIFVKDTDLEGPLGGDIAAVLNYGRTGYGSETFTS